LRAYDDDSTGWQKAAPIVGRSGGLMAGGVCQMVVQLVVDRLRPESVKNAASKKTQKHKRQKTEGG